MINNIKSKNALIIILIIGVIVFLIFNDDSDSGYDYENNNYFKEEKNIERKDAINEYWVEIKNYVSGTETIDVCSEQNGKCYSVDVDITSGIIEIIYFSNGGRLYFSADVDKYGNASDSDKNGNEWDFYLDMHSSIVDAAIYDWANDNDYEIK